MELLIGHLKLDVLILFSDIVDERVDWRLCRGLRQVVGGEVDVEAIRVRIEPVLKFLQTQDVGAVLVLGVRSAHLHNSVLLLRWSHKNITFHKPNNKTSSGVRLSLSRKLR